MRQRVLMCFALLCSLAFAAAATAQEPQSGTQLQCYRACDPGYVETLPEDTTPTTCQQCCDDTFGGRYVPCMQALAKCREKCGDTKWGCRWGCALRKQQCLDRNKITKPFSCPKQ